MTAQKRRLGKGLDALLSSTRFEPEQDIETKDTQSDNTAIEAFRSDAMVQTAMPSGMASGVPSGVPSGAAAAVMEPVDLAVTEDRMVMLPLEKITRNPHQPRQQWNETALYELAESIKANGVIQPVVVRQMGQSFQLIAGERRLRASRLAGKREIPALVRQADEEQMLEWALVENIHRADLNPMERARAYEHYLKTFSLTQEQAAKRLGENRSTVANYVRLLELPESVRQMVSAEDLSMGHARALLGAGSARAMVNLANKVVTEKLSVRQLEAMIRQHRQDDAGEK